MARDRRRPSDLPDVDLFSFDAGGEVAHRLDGFSWPDPARFPVNRGSAKVRQVLWADLVGSPAPVMVAGYASIAQLVDLVAEWGDRKSATGRVRVLLGAEPFGTTRRDFSSSTADFTKEVQRYWLEERGISLHHSARVIKALDAIADGQLEARFLHGANRLHAKVYVGSEAATLGSSNFTRAGLSDQVEVDARFSRDSEPKRYEELVAIAENLWSAGSAWTDELQALLNDLLQVVGWREALARACAELLEGEWADRYLGTLTVEGGLLWPSQRAGIAQALWVTREVGSVLVADATGSGKTRMGAHLVRAVRDRMWSTGRVRRDLCVLVSPPPVTDIWDREALRCGLPLRTASHGMLSRSGPDGPRIEEEAVASAQILAVDEAHNFLNRDSNRTRLLRRSRADHVLLFTATPINRGPGDLLALVNLLGADNFDDSTLDTLTRLAQRRTSQQALSADQHRHLRSEIARFTVRRTKTVLNELVDRDHDAYRHPDTGRVCRYPVHDSRTYNTGETDTDARTANEIRTVAAALTGVGRLERRLAVPTALRAEYSDERWLAFRLRSTRGLAHHHVLAALRSSRAAITEHLEGTAVAVERYRLAPHIKASPTGNAISAVEARADEGPPASELECQLPTWLEDPDMWAAECRAEAGRLRTIADLVAGVSPAREQTKATVVAELASRLERVLAFDQHPITLAALHNHLTDMGVDAVVATGSDHSGRQRVLRMFRRDATGQAVALCSDALNEGLNLQGAAALVHLDLPTTLRVAEQRVGRVDRMDSPHDRIEVHWPKDGPAFATRANELLAQRSDESTRLLGSNLDIPDLGSDSASERIVAVEERIAEAEQPGAEQWDGIQDALEPVRSLVSGDAPLVTPDAYDRMRHVQHRVVARVSLVRAHRPWAFLAVAGSSDNSPRWHFLSGERLGQAAVDLPEVCRLVREELANGPPDARFDSDAADLLDLALTTAAHREFDQLPRRLFRALSQMRTVLEAWAAVARRVGEEQRAETYRRVAALAHPQGAGTSVDPYLIAERWLTLVGDVVDEHRRRQRHRPYVVLDDVTPSLKKQPMAAETVVAAFADLPEITPLAERVTACILGVPDGDRPSDWPVLSDGSGWRGSR